MKKTLLVFVIALVCFVQLTSAPYNGEVFSFEQPDGSTVEALIFGDEFYARCESFDGYTLVRDEETGWLCYAELSEDKTKLVSTGIKYLGKSSLKSSLSIKKHIDISDDSRLSLADGNKALLGDEELTSTLKATTANISGTVKGITILVDFSDKPAKLPVEDFEEMLNGDNFTKDGNNGSVKKYYADISNGKLTYENVVFGWFRAPKTFAEYDKMAYASGAKQILKLALKWVDEQGFDFSTLSVDGNKKIKAVNLVYTGYPKAWSKGMWWHKSNWYGFSADGVGTKVYNCSPGNSPMKISTICHENGHMICGWPDTYKYKGGQDGLSSWDIMCSSGSKNPPPPNPVFRYNAGWSEEIEITEEHTDITTVANDFLAYKYTNPKDPKEYYLIESRLKKGRHGGIPDSGLTIWHVNKKYSNQAKLVEEQKIYIEHACSQYNAHNRTCYKKSREDEFSSNTLPSSNWHSGEKSNFRVYDISDVGETMTFKVDFTDATLLNKDFWSIEEAQYVTLIKDATNAFDKSCYSAFRCKASPTTPYEMVINLGASYDLSQLKYLPRYQKGNNSITQYEIYVSDDKTNWGTAVSSGNWDSNHNMKSAEFTATGQFVKITGLSNTTAEEELSILELYLYGSISPNSKPNKAYTPTPFVNKKMVGINGTLNWTSGEAATSHIVYFSEDATIDESDMVSEQTGNEYSYSGLNTGTTYYWRVDEVNENGITTGDVWSFTTYSEEPILLYEFEDNLIDSYGTSDGTHVQVGDGTIETYETGVDGKAYKFSVTASNGYNYLKTPSNIANLGREGNQYTVSGWYKIINDEHALSTNLVLCQVTAGSGTQRSIFNAAKKGNDPYWLCFNTYLTGANVPSLPDNDVITGSENMVLPLDEWFYLTVTVSSNASDPTKKDVKTYLNGELIGSVAGKSIAEQDGYITLGYKEGNDFMFNGLIDNFALYAYPLNSDQINSIYNEGLPTAIKRTETKTGDMISYSISKQIIVKTNFTTNKNLVIYNLDGRPVFSTETSDNNITTRELPNGVYLVTLYANKKLYTNKVVVK